MKKIIFAVAISLFVSCTKESSIELESTQEKTLSVTTRAGSSDWIDGEELAIFDLTNNKNTTYVYNSGVWSADAPLGWLSNSIELCGYLVKIGAGVDGVVLSDGEDVDQTTTDKLATYDYQYYYSPAVELSTEGVAIEMDYILSKLVVNVVTDGADIEGVSIIGTPSSMTFEGGEWSAEGNNINTLACGGSSASQFTAYVVPSEWESPQITFTNSNGEVITATYSTAITLEASKVYTLSVVISDGMEATFDSNFTVSDWANGDSLGSYDEYMIDIWDGSIASDFGGGTGTTDDPYQINSASELAYLASVVNSNSGYKQQYSTKYFELTTNLDLNGENYYWIPIGQTNTVGFGGSFDGAGYSISNMNVDQSEDLGSASYDGLFGFLNGNATINAIIKDITITDGSVISAGANAGILCGYVQNYVQFKNCIVRDSYINSIRTSTPSANIGGIVGQILQETISIENCHVENTEIYSSLFYNNMGGVVGKTGSTWTNIITGSSFSGTIDYDSEVVTGSNTISGGIVGAMAVEGSTIIGCYSTGSINGKLSGGLVGTCYSSIIGCYTTANVSSTTRGGALTSTLTYSSTVADVVKSFYYTYSDVQAFGQTYDGVDNDDYLVDEITQTQMDNMNSAISDYYGGSPTWNYVESSVNKNLPFVIESVASN